VSLVVPFEEIFSDKSGLLANHSSWERVGLSQACTVVNGYPFKSSLFNRDKGFPIIRIRDLDDNRTNTRYNGNIPKEVLIQDGDLLIGMDGIFRCVEWRGGEAGLNQRVCKIIPNEQFLDRKFLLFGINGYLKAIEEATSSVTVGHLSSRDILKIPFPLAPLNEQRRIVAKLEKLLSKVNTCQKRLAKIPILLKRFRQSVLAAACSGRLTADWRDENSSVELAWRFFEKVSKRRREAWKNKVYARSKRQYREPEDFDSENLPDVPESWMWVSADAVCSQITDGEHIQPPYQTDGHPMLSAKHVRDGFVTMENAGLISERDFKKALERCEPVNGDILIVSVGATTGRTAIIRDCPPFAIVRSVLLLKPLIAAEFFLRCLQSPWCFRWMTKASGASAQPHLYIKDTKRLPIPFPPLAEQQEIVRRVEMLFALADQIEARYVKAKTHVDKLTQSILAKAFRGELVPQDPNDEPASALLERIKQREDPDARSKRKTKRVALSV
jgi:type I restriction enzyme, S subunit